MSNESTCLTDHRCFRSLFVVRLFALSEANPNAHCKTNEHNNVKHRYFDSLLNNICHVVLNV